MVMTVVTPMDTQAGIPETESKLLAKLKNTKELWGLASLNMET